MLLLFFFFLFTCFTLLITKKYINRPSDAIGHRSSYYLTDRTLNEYKMDKDQFALIRVKSKEKLIFQPPDNVLDNLADLSTDYDFNPNSNNSDLINFDNSQLSTFFRYLSDSPTPSWKDEKTIAATNFKTVKGLGFYFCRSCPFLCLTLQSFMQHNENNRTEHSTIKSIFKIKCIGCDNIFYSLNVLRVSVHFEHFIVRCT